MSIDPTGQSPVKQSSALVLPAALSAGTVVDGKYEIIELLGRGGMCTVYKARHVELDKPVALKMLHRHLVADIKAIQRFEREAKTICALDHPNIIKVYSFGCWNSQPYLALEYLQGVSLADVLGAVHTLPIDR